MQIHPITCGIAIAFLIEAPHGLYLVDCGLPGYQEAVLRKMRALRRSDLKLIWITHTHYDHCGSAAALRALTGARVGVHAADAESLCRGRSPLGTAHNQGFLWLLIQPLANQIRRLPVTPPDLMLEDGDSLEGFGLDAAILHTPGHTPGHTCLLLREGIAFGGDLIGRSPRLGLQCLLADDWSQLPGSLARLQAAHPAWVYTGHFKRPISGAALQKIKPGVSA